jgi:hypothetical protein
VYDVWNPTNCITFIYVRILPLVIIQFLLPVIVLIIIISIIIVIIIVRPAWSFRWSRRWCWERGYINVESSGWLVRQGQRTK